jgi:hypothetical protein
MSDTIDDYRALKQSRQAEAATKRAEAPDWLRRLNVDFTEHNGGAHLIITFSRTKRRVDYWPGTDCWMEPGKRARHGLQQLEKRLCALRDEDASLLAQDYANLELRVLANDAAYVAAMERAYPHLKGED